MDVDALLDAFQDFEKKVKRDTSPFLDQFLCHVAKTGQATIPWSQFKTYFMFKLEKVMDDFHASTPEQRGLHNPNVEYVPFEEMKKRILKIVDGYNGIPFTIQRLCELLTDPKRNYTGTDKFLRGIEKNVMVVSCVYPTSEKNGASGVNRVNGVMFPGNSVYSESRNVNGPGTPKPLHRPKLSTASSLSTNGLPECTADKEPEPSGEEAEDRGGSETPPSEGEFTNCGTKNKYPEGEDDASDGDRHKVKRQKFDERREEAAEGEEKDPSCREGVEEPPEMPEASADSCRGEYKSETSAPEDGEPSSTQAGVCATEGASPEAEDEEEDEEEEEEEEATRGVNHDVSVQRPELHATSEENSSSGQDSGESSSSSSSSSDGETQPSSKALPPSSSNSPDLSTEGNADDSESAETAIEPGEHD